MPSIELSDDDYNFLKAQAELEEVSLGEYLSFMVDRQRVIVKYKEGTTYPSNSNSANIEAPHRKWGM